MMTPPKDNNDYLNHWVRHYSETVQTSLCRYYEWFGFVLSNETHAICDTLPGYNYINPFPLLLNLEYLSDNYCRLYSN